MDSTVSPPSVYSASPVPTLIVFIGGAVASESVASASSDMWGHLVMSTAMPIITPVAEEAWSVKEAMASEADMPEWGSQEEQLSVHIFLTAGNGNRIAGFAHICFLVTEQHSLAAQCVLCVALKGLDIFKLTPKTNCKECGSPTCMAFAMKVAQGAVDIAKCPSGTEPQL